MRHITQLDLFSGIGGFHLGFERAGYKVTSFFSEVDKHAIAVYKNQFKDSTYVGSVTDVRGADLPSIDLITFGSPCQDFSLAGKRAGMEGQRSSLVLEAIRLIHECRPRVFIWENVKGTFSSNDGADFWAIIQAFANIGGYRCEWQLCNTSWVLPQNRERIYLVGYSTAPERGWRGVFPVGEEIGKSGEIKQTASLTGGQLGRVLDPNGIGYALSACDYKDPMKVEIKQIGTKLDSNGGTQPYQQDRVYDADGTTSQQLEMVQEPKGINKVTYGKHQQDCYYEIDGNMCSIPAGTHGSTPHLLKIKVKSANQKGYQEAEAGDAVRLYQPESNTQRGRVGKGIAHTLETTGQQGVVQPNYTYEAANELVRRNTLNEGEVKGLDFYNQSVRDVIPTLTDPKHNSQGLFDGYRIRRLTPIECERLQGFPDDHTAFGNYDGEVKPMSNTQRYKQCGNAVTVDIVSLVAEQLKPIFDA
jgi:DNA (cytosine-5)-methyltransferase 1